MPLPDPTDVTPLLIADGDIPTTRLLVRELRQGFADVDVRIPDTLFGATVDDRPILISRLCHPAFGWLSAHLVDRGCPYAYFLDDNFWELTAEVDPHLAAFFSHPAVIDTLDGFVTGAHRVIVWTTRMADYVRARFPEADVAMVSPGFDVAAVERAAQAPATFGMAQGILRVGYPTTRKPGIGPLLCEIVGRSESLFGPKIQFEFMGWMPDALGSAPNATLLPQVDDYGHYLESILNRRWGAGIAPLAPGHFESFKTDIKYREYGGCRIPGIYSAVPPYSDVVDDGRTGLLVNNEPAEWLAAFDRLLVQPAYGAAIAAAAFADVSERRDIKVTGQRFCATLREMAFRR